MTMSARPTFFSLLLLPLIAGPALAESGALDARAIEARLYQQGYQRISHIDFASGAYTARALDHDKRPVFLGISPMTGDVIEAHPMR